MTLGAKDVVCLPLGTGRWSLLATFPRRGELDGPLPLHFVLLRPGKGAAQISRADTPGSMATYDDDDDDLALLLETEILSETSDLERDPPCKKPRLDDTTCGLHESGTLSGIPRELFHHILKFLSPEDLVSCSLACKFLNFAASDESLWRRLYCMRWGPALDGGKLRVCAWKKLYIQRDGEDMVEFARNTPSEFKEYYIQMQAAKRSQAPSLSQVDDDSIILDPTVADQVSMWRSTRGLTEECVVNHACSGETCSYSQIGNVFLCEKTGRLHVCDETCRETVLDSDGLLVCTVSGHCFDRLVSASEEETNVEQLQGGISDEVEPFMGSGRFARAYSLGYNCVDEKELERALQFC